MNTLKLAVISTLLASELSTARESTAVPVTVDNFARAESHRYFARFAGEGGFGELKHERELADIDNQTVIRLNRDTLYSFGVFDLEASDLTVSLPDAGQRFMAVQVINEDHYTPEVFYAPDSRTLTKESVGSRYVCLAVRTFVDPNDPEDVKRVHALQDDIRLGQESTGELDLPAWDKASLDAIRKALLALAEANGGLDSSRMFGTREQVDPVQHLLGSAAGWGGNPRSTALYEGVNPEKNDGTTPHTLTLRDVPVDGFWSVSVYNAEGYFEKNDRNAYTVNNVTAKANEDGSTTIHFGGDPEAANFIPIMPGWNYLIRLYRPRKPLLDGDWALPAAKATE